MSLSWGSTSLILAGLFAISLGFSWQRHLVFLLLLASVCLYFQATVKIPTINSQGTSGIALLRFSSVSCQTMKFGSRYIYRGVIKEFWDAEHKNLIAKNIPCQLTLNTKTWEKRRPDASYEYAILATLYPCQTYAYSLKVKNTLYWQPLKKVYNLAEWRLKAKRAVKAFIQDIYEKNHVSQFLAGLLVGEFDDHQLNFHFARFSLQHVLAISGFHFAAMSQFLKILLRFLKRESLSRLLNVFFLALYFIFLGPLPSIIRAWMSSSMHLIALLKGRSYQSLNALGAALIAIFFFDPFLIFHLGFQLSFLATASIIFFMPSIERGLHMVVTKRSLSHLLNMSYLNQLGYCMLHFFKQHLSLTLAVNLTLLPYLLSFFHRYPLFSLVYNLFFPFCISMLYPLVILTCLIRSIVSPLSTILSTPIFFITERLLDTVLYLPTQLDIFIRTDYFTKDFTLLYLGIIYLIRIYRYKNVDENITFA